MEFGLRVQGLTTGSERVGGPVLVFVIPDAGRATDNTTCAWSVLQVAFHFALTHRRRKLQGSVEYQAPQRRLDRSSRCIIR